MKTSKFSNETVLYIILFALALGYRLIDLGRVPLSDSEASLALNALGIANWQNVSFLSQPGYISLTSFLFFLFGAGDALARLVPALSGALLVLAPLAFRRQLGARTSLLLALFLAVDPGLAAFSRQAGGTMLTLAFTLLAFGLIVNRRMVLGGICAGFALLGGPQLWPGLISGGLALWLSGDVFGWRENRPEQPGLEENGSPRFPFSLGMAGLAAGITAILVATKFFAHPQGLNGLANGLVDYIRSWAGGFHAPAIESFLLFFFYESFFLLLALFRGVRAWFARDDLDKFFFRWMVAAILLSLVNPGQSFSSSAWVLVPMLALSARAIGDLIPERFEWGAPAGAQAILVFALTVFAVQNLLSLSLGWASVEDMRLKVIAVGGSLAIIGLASYLLGTSWGWKATAPGFVLGLAALAVFSVASASWHAAGLGVLPDREMWRNDKTVISGDLLKKTVSDISEYNTGRRDRIDVTMVGMDSPAMDWLLRDFPRVSHVNEVVGGENASILVTPADKLPPLGDRYRGQKLEWENRPAWDLIGSEEWPRWLFSREATLDPTSIIVWVRSDLFPGAPKIDNPAPQNPPQ